MGNEIYHSIFHTDCGESCKAVCKNETICFILEVDLRERT